MRERGVSDGAKDRKRSRSGCSVGHPNGRSHVDRGVDRPVGRHDAQGVASYIAEKERVFEF